MIESFEGPVCNGLGGGLSHDRHLFLFRQVELWTTNVYAAQLTSYVRQLTTHSRTAGSARCSVNGHELTRKTRHEKAVL